MEVRGITELGKFEGSGDHRDSITREGPHASSHLSSDNQLFLVNINCCVFRLLHYIRSKVGLAKTGEEFGEGNNGQGSEVVGSSLAPKPSCWQKESSLNPDNFFQPILDRITGPFHSCSPSLPVPINYPVASLQIPSICVMNRGQ